MKDWPVHVNNTIQQKFSLETNVQYHRWIIETLMTIIVWKQNETH